METRSDGLAWRAGHEIHLWITDIDDPSLDAMWPAYRAVLSEAERARELRFRFEKDQRRYLVSHALLRTTLSRYAGVAPAQWVFGQNAQGKPYVVHRDRGARAIRFNLSHAGRLAVVAVAWRRPVGVDVEDASRQTSIDLVARSFHPDEQADVARQPESQRAARFFEYWALKEAYIKARGKGLSIPLNAFGVDLRQAAVARLHGDDVPSVRGLAWPCWLWRALDDHPLALCTRLADAQPMPIVQAWRTRPLIDVRPHGCVLLRAPSR